MRKKKPVCRKQKNRKEKKKRRKKNSTRVKIGGSKRETPHHTAHEPPGMMVQCWFALQPGRRSKALFFIAAMGETSSPAFLVL